MRLGIAAVGVVALGVVTVLAVQRLNDAERFRQLVDTGERALAAGNSYAAIEAFSGAIALRSDSMASHLRRGEAYRAQRRLEEAGRDFREAVRLQPGATEPLMALAALYEGQGNPAAAAEWLGRAAAIDRQSPTLLYRLALTRYRSGQAAAAREPLRQAVALNPGFDEALYLLGLTLRDTQDTAGAVEALERAVRTNPSLAPAREELADLYRAQQRPAEEMAQLTALASQEPGTGRDVAIALAQARRGDFDAADATLAAAADRAPEDSSLALTRGRVHVWRAEAVPPGPQRGRWATEAIPALERALGGTVRRSEGLALYGRALFLRGDIADAARILREAVATTPFSRLAFLYLADAAEALNDPIEARHWLLRYDALDGEVSAPDIRAARTRRLGGLAVAAGDYRDARTRLEPLLTSAPQDVELLGWIAEARWHTGDIEQARAALALGLSVAPRDATLRRLRPVIR
ncbi:MAG: tetratricopeptide repeat protein [Acidimicrobiia bacterium]|nr:tetratricopeptide repeat protein [Acidimicrobiia bacterium]